ncbi:HET-domain-containing protein [Xylariaceae sp. FL0804]|nr:HET-domain-containing protein [Xylariaceae sp. FL0804]
MWLLNTATLRLESFDEVRAASVPYAILSHVWGKGEVLFHEVEQEQKHHDDDDYEDEDGDASIQAQATGKEKERKGRVQRREGWAKIRGFFAAARRLGLSHAWIDTCCIDKRNSADLSEALNSMYAYYRDANVCLIYLRDVPGPPSPTEQQQQQEQQEEEQEEETRREAQLGAVRASVWFSRGWTLQELLAPARRRFFAEDWTEIPGGEGLDDVLAAASGIDHAVIRDRDIVPKYSVAERMSWAAGRRTTRPEDAAYSLMGIFGVSMPVLYGEGMTKAFMRLQAEIMQMSFDMTIFAWRGGYHSSGLLAHSPSDFAGSTSLQPWGPYNVAPFSMTNVGLFIMLNITTETPNSIRARQPAGRHHLAALQCDIWTPGRPPLIPMIYLEGISDASFVVNGKARRAYRRVRCAEWVTWTNDQLGGCPYEEVLVLQDEQFALLWRAREQHNVRWDEHSHIEYLGNGREEG